MALKLGRLALPTLFLIMVISGVVSGTVGGTNTIGYTLSDAFL